MSVPIHSLCLFFRRLLCCLPLFLLVQTGFAVNLHSDNLVMQSYYKVGDTVTFHGTFTCVADHQEVCRLRMTSHIDAGNDNPLIHNWTRINIEGQPQWPQGWIGNSQELPIGVANFFEHNVQLFESNLESTFEVESGQLIGFTVTTNIPAEWDGHHFSNRIIIKGQDGSNIENSLVFTLQYDPKIAIGSEQGPNLIGDSFSYHNEVIARTLPPNFNNVLRIETRNAIHGNIYLPYQFRIQKHPALLIPLLHNNHNELLHDLTLMVHLINGEVRNIIITAAQLHINNDDEWAPLDLRNYMSIRIVGNDGEHLYLAILQRNAQNFYNGLQPHIIEYRQDLGPIISDDFHPAVPIEQVQQEFNQEADDQPTYHLENFIYRENNLGNLPFMLAFAEDIDPMNTESHSDFFQEPVDNALFASVPLNHNPLAIHYATHASLISVPTGTHLLYTPVNTQMSQALYNQATKALGNNVAINAIEVSTNKTPIKNVVANYTTNCSQKTDFSWLCKSDGRKPISGLADFKLSVALDESNTDSDTIITQWKLMRNGANVKKANDADLNASVVTHIEPNAVNLSHNIAPEKITEYTNDSGEAIAAITGTANGEHFDSSLNITRECNISKDGVNKSTISYDLLIHGLSCNYAPNVPIVDKSTPSDNLKVTKWTDDGILIVKANKLLSISMANCATNRVKYIKDMMGERLVCEKYNLPDNILSKFNIIMSRGDRIIYNEKHSAPNSLKENNELEDRLQAFDPSICKNNEIVAGQHSIQCKEYTTDLVKKSSAAESCHNFQIDKNGILTATCTDLDGNQISNTVDYRHQAPYGFKKVENVNGYIYITPKAYGLAEGDYANFTNIRNKDTLTGRLGHIHFYDPDDDKEHIFDNQYNFAGGIVSYKDNEDTSKNMQFGYGFDKYLIPPGSYNKLCTNVHVDSNYQLTATCKNIRGGTKQSTIYIGPRSGHVTGKDGVQQAVTLPFIANYFIRVLEDGTLKVEPLIQSARVYVQTQQGSDPGGHHWEHVTGAYLRVFTNAQDQKKEVDLQRLDGGSYSFDDTDLEDYLFERIPPILDQDNNSVYLFDMTGHAGGPFAYRYSNIRIWSFDPYRKEGAHSGSIRTEGNYIFSPELAGVTLLSNPRNIYKPAFDVKTNFTTHTTSVDDFPIVNYEGNIDGMVGREVRSVGGAIAAGAVIGSSVVVIAALITCTSKNINCWDTIKEYLGDFFEDMVNGDGFFVTNKSENYAVATNEDPQKKDDDKEAVLQIVV